MSADLELDNFGHRNLGNIEKFGHIGKFAHIRILAHYSQRKSWTIGHIGKIRHRNLRHIGKFRHIGQLEHIVHKKTRRHSENLDI